MWLRHWLILEFLSSPVEISVNATEYEIISSSPDDPVDKNNNLQGEADQQHA